MAANGISTLSTKQAKQEAKLALAANNRIGDNRPSVLNTALLPTKYSGNSLIQNSHPNGLQSKRPWVDFTVDNYMQYQSDGFSFDFTKTDRFFQENIGLTLADDVGEVIGLALESREWNSRTLAEELAGQTELRGNGSISTVGVATPATYNTANGQGTLNRVDISNSSGVKITVEAGKYYILDIEKTGGAGTLTIREVSVIATSPGTHPQTRSLYYIKASDSNDGIYISNSVNGTSVDFTLHSIKEVPTHHGVQSSASLKPKRQVFYGYSDDQPELVTNGGFDTDSGWTKGTGWTINGGKAVQDGTGSSINGLLDSIATDFENAKTYRVEFTISEYTSGGVRSLIYGDGFVGIGSARSANGTYVEVLTINNSSASATNVLRFQPYPASFSGKIDNISVKEVPASRITTGCKFDGIDDNLLTTYTANVVAGGAERFADPTCDNSGSWANQSGWSVTGGKLVGTSVGAYGPGQTSQVNPALIVGRTYAVTYTISGYSTGSVRGQLIGGTNVNLTARSANGTYTQYVTVVDAHTDFGFQATATFTGSIDNISVKEVTNQDNFIVAYVNVPTTISAFQYITNAANASGGERFGIGINTDGTLGIGVGSESPASGAGKVSAGGDLRGRSIVVGMAFNGTTMRAFVDDEEALSVAQSGVPIATVPVRIGSGNANGTATATFSGTVEQIIAGSEFLTFERYMQIRNEMIGN